MAANPKKQTYQELKQEMLEVARGERAAPSDAGVESFEGFIQDDMAAEKNERRKVFFDAVKQGEAKSSDASIFKGMKMEVKFGKE